MGNTVEYIERTLLKIIKKLRQNEICNKQRYVMLQSVGEDMV